MPFCLYFVIYANLRIPKFYLKTSCISKAKVIIMDRSASVFLSHFYEEQGYCSDPLKPTNSRGLDKEKTKIQIQHFSCCEVTALTTEPLCCLRQPTEWSKSGSVRLPTVPWYHPNHHSTHSQLSVPTAFEARHGSLPELNILSVSQYMNHSKVVNLGWMCCCRTAAYLRYAPLI